MKIKISIITLCLSSLFLLTSAQDTGTYTITVPQYQAQPCMTSFLSAIVKANKAYYDNQQYFYCLSLYKARNYLSLYIHAEQFHAVRDTGYVGSLTITGTTFLCQGDLSDPSLFTRIPSAAQSLTLRKDNNDPDHSLFPQEPVLQGAYLGCRTSPIVLEVYVRARIPALEMKVHPLEYR